MLCLSLLFIERRFLSSLGRCSLQLLSRKIPAVAVSHHTLLLHPSLDGICGVTAAFAFLGLGSPSAAALSFLQLSRHCHKHRWLLPGAGLCRDISGDVWPCDSTGDTC